MRTRTALASAGIIVALLTGCASSQAPPKPKPTPASDKFLGAIVDHPIHSWDDNGPTQKELLAYPKKWCAGLEEGHSVKYLFSSDGADLYPIGWDWGTEKADAHKVLLMAVDAYCPKYRNQVTKELRESGDF